MEKANETNLPRISQVVRVTPAQLRMIADKLEIASKNAQAGQEINYDFTKGIAFHYDPEIPAFRDRPVVLGDSAVALRQPGEELTQ